jgi:hypothetical protein
MRNFLRYCNVQEFSNIQRGLFIMSVLDCYQLVETYAHWLKEKVKVKKIGDICELTTPFVDRHNDYLQLYIKATPSGLLLTDDGYIIRDLEISGKSGFNHHFDFVIPSSKKEPERILKAINNPTKNNISAMIFSWDDTRKIRSENSIALAVLNDQDKEITPDTLHALKAYEIEPMVWSKREGYIEQLVA